MAHTGRCLCDSVVVSIDREPIGTRTCLCRDCQKFGGGNGTTNAFFAEDSVSYQGELSWYESLADSGNTTWRGFCPKCGSHIFTKGSGRPDLIGIRLGALDDSDLVTPQATIWTESAPTWAVFDPDLPQFPKAPPPA